VALCLLFSVGILYSKIGKGSEFFPEGDPERGVIDVRTPQSTNITETDRIIRDIENRITPYRPWIKHTIANVGFSAAGNNIMASAGGSHLANITLVFHDFSELSELILQQKSLQALEMTF